MATVDVTWRDVKRNEQLAPDVTSRVAKLNEQLAHYIPPRETWNPADEALFLPTDLYQVLPAEAHAMQLRAIKYTFTRHYDTNGFYNEVLHDAGRLTR